MHTIATILCTSYTIALTAAWVNNLPRTKFHTTRNKNTNLFSTTTTEVEFAKYHGLGNDFILIDDRDKSTPSLTSSQSETLCNRNFGIGGDGVIFALKPPSSEYDFAMRIYNSDGSEPEMCGNGIRCYAKFLEDLGEGKEEFKIHTLAGMIIPVMKGGDKGIAVDMGEPILSGADVPCTLDVNGDDNSVVEQVLTANGKEWKVNAVSMGNPHCIIFVDDIEAVDLAADGPAIESHPSFPAKTNVEFVQVAAENHLIMKVWERGAGPTLACGTGACALTVAAIRAGKIPRGGEVKVTLPGGDLFIEWREQGNKVYMTGPAERVFNGKISV